MILFIFYFCIFADSPNLCKDLTGGHAVFFLAAYSYISDVTDPESRTKRFAYLDGLFPLGFHIAKALSGPIQKHLGLIYNFAIGMLFAVLCLAYCIIFVKESRPKVDKKLARETISTEHTKGSDGKSVIFSLIKT